MVKKHTTKAMQSQPIQRLRLGWGEPKIAYASQVTPTAHQLAKAKAAQLRVSQGDLLEYLFRALDDPAVVQAITKQIKA